MDPDAPRDFEDTAPAQAHDSADAARDSTDAARDSTPATGPHPYSEEESRLLAEAAAEVVLAAVAAEASGPVAYFREMTAAGTYLFEARERYADNRLVQAAFERASSARAEGEARAEEVTEERMLEHLGRVGSTLRHDAEGDGFRTFLMELAERIVGAAGSGFLGFGERVSEQERAFLAELRARLDVREGAGAGEGSAPGSAG